MTSPQAPPQEQEQVPPPSEELTAAEAVFYALVFAMIAQMLAAVAGRVLYPIQLGGLPDPTGIWFYQDRWDEDMNRLAGRLEAEFGPLPPGYTDMVRSFVADFPNELYTTINTKIAKMASDGASRDDIIAAVKDLLEPGTWAWKAEQIAVTEANAAENAARFQAAQKIRGAAVTKTWQTKQDKAVRSTHKQANQQTVALLDTYTVGGFPALYPGDPNLPPQERVGCRCRSKYREVARA
jgi:hypothetical protein